MYYTTKRCCCLMCVYLVIIISTIFLFYRVFGGLSILGSSFSYNKNEDGVLGLIGLGFRRS